MNLFFSRSTQNAMKNRRQVNWQSPSSDVIQKEYLLPVIIDQLTSLCFFILFTPCRQPFLQGNTAVYTIHTFVFLCSSLCWLIDFLKALHAQSGKRTHTHAHTNTHSQSTQHCTFLQHITTEQQFRCELKAVSHWQAKYFIISAIEK